MSRAALVQERSSPVSRRARRCARVLMMALCAAVSGAASAAGPEAHPAGAARLIEHLDPPTSLAGTWRFRTGDDPGWASPRLDDGGWARIQVPGPWGRQGYRGHAGFAWYRLELALGAAAAAAARVGALGLRFGNVDGAYELYVGGLLVGSVGGLPPRSLPMYDRHAVFAVPPVALGDDARLVIALRVWRSPSTRDFEGGLTGGPVQIGRFVDLQRDLLLADFPYLVLAVLFCLAGVYHLHLFQRRTVLREYLWFGVTALLLAAYTFLRTQVRFVLCQDFALLKNLEYLALYLVPVASIQFFYGTFFQRIPWLVRTIQLASGALAIAAVATPTLDLNLATLSAWQYTIVLLTVGTFFLVLRERQRGHPDARSFIGSFSLLGLAVVNDILRDRGLVQTPSMIPYGFALFVISMAASLANRFARTYAAVENLNVELEDRVRVQTLAIEERTSELESKNKQLEKAYGHVHDASLTDPLTGVRNRRFYQEHIGFDVSRVVREHAADAPAREGEERQRSVLVFVLVDVDHFKRVNDRHGHGAGDQVLAQVGTVLRAVCRGSDYLVRWGGEEFLIVSRFADRTGAAVLAERLRSAIAGHVFVFGAGLQGRITASVGFACFPLHESDPKALSHEAVLELADTCLYRVKETGRNGWMGAVRAEAPPGRILRIGRGGSFACEGLEIASSWNEPGPERGSSR